MGFWANTFCQGCQDCMIRVHRNVLWEIIAGNNVTLFFISSVLEQKIFSVVLKLHSTCSDEKFNFFFFRNFRRHFPDSGQPFLKKNARTGFYVICDTFCKKKQKTSILRLLTVFQEQNFGRVDKTTFHLTRGTFWKQNVFCRKLTLWSF